MINFRLRNTGSFLLLNNALWDLPAPINLSLWWNFGSLLGLVLVIQVGTGLFLSIHYTADVHLAFSALAHIVRDVNGGWLLRSIHINGASFFFLFLFCHIGRGLYHGSYYNNSLWMTGVLLLLMVIATAFLGYVLPWGQMSFWGATVITNLFGAIPYVGGDVLFWLWGGFSVDNATLTRFYSLHFFLPLLVVGLVVIHLFLLHISGSSNPLGLNSCDNVPFHWYFTINDILGFLLFIFIFIFLVLFSPNLMGEPDNFMMANPMVTPTHIVPEWYFLFAYAILRSIPNNIGGVIGLFCSVLFLIFIPFMNNYYFKGNVFQPLMKVSFYLYVLSFFLLTLAGTWPVEAPYLTGSRLFSLCYFSYFPLFRLCQSR